jgi:hypothetical protein
MMLAPQLAARLATGHVLARPSTSLAPRIVILGGGFAGVTTALELAKRCAGVLPVHLTLVSEHNFFLFTPMLAEAATGAVETRHVLYPIRPLCGVWGIEFGEMSVEAIDLGRRRLIARHRRSPVRQQVHYDKLVLALGAAPNVAAVPGAAEHALTFKAVGDAVRIRNHLALDGCALDVTQQVDDSQLVQEVEEVVQQRPFVQPVHPIDDLRAVQASRHARVTATSGLPTQPLRQVRGNPFSCLRHGPPPPLQCCFPIEESGPGIKARAYIGISENPDRST